MHKDIGKIWVKIHVKKNKATVTRQKIPGKTTSKLKFEEIPKKLEFDKNSLEILNKR